MLTSLFLLLFLTSTTAAALHRRILHQPFFPQDSFPPSQPPIPSTPPYPFSSTTPNNDSTPFFPSYHTPPPPPSPASLASFPANISPLTVPNSSESKSSSKLIIAAASAVSAAVVIILLALFVHLRKQRLSSLPSKTQRSNTNTNTITRIPKLQRPSQTSSEFLYLGTLVNSHAINHSIAYPNKPRSNGSASSDSRKLDSPELRPLPPLNSQHQQRNYRSAGSSKDDDEEFYSPRGGSSIDTGSASRSGFAFAAVQIDNFNGSTSNSSSSYSSSVSGSGSGSLVRSVSLSLSPVNSASPRNLIPKSPDLIELQNIMPLQQRITSPQQIPALKESQSPSPRSSSSPDRYSRISEESSSPRILNFEFPVRNNSTVPHKSTAIAPPPPPPPPPQSAKRTSPTRPAASITTVKLIAVESPALVSPIELRHLPSNDSESPNKEKEYDQSGEEITPKPKLKPLHWDKVRASSDREMVWDQLKCSSFKVNEEMIETLFVVNTPKPSPKEATRWLVLPSPGVDNGNRVLDTKKAQNIAIMLRALNVTVEDVCDGLLEGNLDAFGTELLESLLKMAPTKEEERKLKEYIDDSPIELGAAEKFLKAILEIPHAFKRIDAMIYVSSFESEVEYLNKSFATLEAACEELRTNRMFLKLLEAVLKTGNRMNVGTNRGDAHAFKLDTLLKLVDVKGADGKTTLLHFVVQEIIRSEGARLSNKNEINSSINDDVKCRKLGLKIVSSLSSELSNVKKAASMDAEVLSTDVSKLSKGIINIEEVSRLNEMICLKEIGSDKFSESMKCFIKKSEEEIIKIQAQESVSLSLVKEITEYFHGNSAKEEAHPFRIFMIVRDFLTVLDRVCKEVDMINERTIINSAHRFPIPINPTLQPISGGFPVLRQHSSSDDESSSS